MVGLGKVAKTCCQNHASSWRYNTTQYSREFAIKKWQTNWAA